MIGAGTNGTDDSEVAMQLGYALSSEELEPNTIVDCARRGEAAGFRSAWVTDHFHPWIDRQGHSPFVWSVIGGISSVTEAMRVGTGVTCPIIRMHPAIVAHAAATAACMLDGRFFLGVGTGEQLNEHVLGDPWPTAPQRMEMLEEAVAVMRSLWRGEELSHRGQYYVVEDARLYTVPESAPPVMVSAFGPAAAEMAARIGDGIVTTRPDRELLTRFAEAGGEGKRKIAGAKVCWARDESEARRLALELWPSSGLPGQLNTELRTPKLFEQATSIVHEDDVVSSMALGPDPQRHVDLLRSYADAGFDEVYVQQIGPDQQGFLRFYEREILPEFASARPLVGSASTP